MSAIESQEVLSEDKVDTGRNGQCKVGSSG